MKIQDVMSKDPICCLPSDTVQRVANLMRDRNVGSLPVVADAQSRRLIGIVTDRDVCCRVVGEGLDPKATTIERYISRNPVTCHADDELEKCEQIMQQHQVRRVPIVDEQNRCIGIVAQADLALKDEPENVQRTVAEISRPSRPAAPSIAA